MSIAQHYQYIIIGAGIAGMSAIKAIREHDSSPILLISNEDRLPYKRTQINKLLSKGFSKDEMAIHDLQYYKQNTIDLLYNEVEAIDIINKSISVNNQKIAFHKLLIATGKQPKQFDLQSIPQSQQFTIYKAEDSERLIDFAKNNKCFLVLGGGVEGVEMAFQLKQMKKSVTLVHNSEHLINRQFSPAISKQIEDTLRENDVEIVKTDHINMDFESDQIVLKNNHSTTYFDAIIECIGAVPNTKLAESSGIKTEYGICVNPYFQTSAKDIFAAGDVAQLVDGAISGLWHFAEYQGELAGKNMCGQTIAYKPKPFRLKTEIFNQFYFSMNYSPVIQYDSIHYKSTDKKYRELYMLDDQLIAALMVNDKENAKLYENAVREGWSLDRINKQLLF